MTIATGGAWAIQTAIRAALAGDSALIALLGDGANSIYDDVPEDEKFPYLTIGDIEASDFSTSTERMAEFSVTINAWTSRAARANASTGYEGRKRARDILDRVYAVLHESSLNLTGHRLINLRFQMASVYRDDPETYHGIIRFRAVTAPA